jgi:O-antigen ligase
MVEPILGEARAAHSTYLMVLVSQGLIGFAIFLGVFALAVRLIRRMPLLERRFWYVWLAVIVIGLIPRTWENRKPLWLLLGMVATQGAVAFPNRRGSLPVWAGTANRRGGARRAARATAYVTRWGGGPSARSGKRPGHYL